jgi:hypothetical protein
MDEPAEGYDDEYMINEESISGNDDQEDRLKKISM